MLSILRCTYKGLLLICCVVAAGFVIVEFDHLLGTKVFGIIVGVFFVLAFATYIGAIIESFS